MCAYESRVIERLGQFPIVIDGAIVVSASTARRVDDFIEMNLETISTLATRIARRTRASRHPRARRRRHREIHSHLAIATSSRARSRSRARSAFFSRFPRAPPPSTSRRRSPRVAARASRDARALVRARGVPSFARARASSANETRRDAPRPRERAKKCGGPRSNGTSAGRAGRRFFGRPATVVGRTRADENAEITEMMMYTDADGEDAGWARRARKEDAARRASGGERSVSTQRLEVRQRVLRLRAHSSPPDSNDSTISQI